MPTEAYALCPRRPMPTRTSYESSKGYRHFLAPLGGDINSGCTRDMMGSGPWGNVELLTLTLSFPSHRKLYENHWE
jgi:hypothetical protein